MSETGSPDTYYVPHSNRLTGLGCGRKLPSRAKFIAHLSRCPKCDAVRCTSVEPSGGKYRCTKWSGHDWSHMNYNYFNPKQRWRD